MLLISTANSFSKLFKGLGIHKVTFHNLRHTFSSILQGELGIGAVVVQGMTGHSSLAMLQKYSHTGLGNKQNAIQALTVMYQTQGKGQFSHSTIKLVLMKLVLVKRGMGKGTTKLRQ